MYREAAATATPLDQSGERLDLAGAVAAIARDDHDDLGLGVVHGESQGLRRSGTFGVQCRPEAGLGDGVRLEVRHRRVEVTAVHRQYLTGHVDPLEQPVEEVLDGRPLALYDDDRHPGLHVPAPIRRSNPAPIPSGSHTNGPHPGTIDGSETGHRLHRTNRRATASSTNHCSAAGSRPRRPSEPGPMAPLTGVGPMTTTSSSRTVMRSFWSMRTVTLVDVPVAGDWPPGGATSWVRPDGSMRPRSHPGGPTSADSCWVTGAWPVRTPWGEFGRGGREPPPGLELDASLVETIGGHPAVGSVSDTGACMANEPPWVCVEATVTSRPCRSGGHRP